MTAAKINPKVLIWTRERAHFSVTDMPKTTKAQEELINIEAGKELPALTQLEKLARKYERP